MFVQSLIHQPLEQPLTHIEALGLRSQHDMANGHASQALAPTQQRIINRLPDIWMRAASQKSRDAELMYKDAFRKLAASPSLANYNHFKICPTASNSIDTIATWLAANNLKTALIEPTFDNLYLILKRRSVDVTPLPEQALCTGEYKMMLSDVDALFLVNPNNPTGQVLTEAQFTDIVEWCAWTGKTLVLDNTFRFFTAQTYDMYEILVNSEVRFLSIEDTGKVWPTQEIKASLIFCSANIFRDIEVIYDEIFLCHSNFALGVLSEFLLDAHERGLEEAVWKNVAAKRKQFRQAIQGAALEIHPAALSSTISVEWVIIRSHFATDIALVEHFKSCGLVLLPGRQFHWSKSCSEVCSNFARFALLKPEAEFNNAIKIIEREMQKIG